MDFIIWIISSLLLMAVAFQLRTRMAILLIEFR
jgi:hypothetical protein